MHYLLALILNLQISYNLVTSEQNFMKLKIKFKQTRVTSAGDTNSPNLLVSNEFDYAIDSFAYISFRQPEVSRKSLKGVGLSI